LRFLILAILIAVFFVSSPAQAGILSFLENLLGYSGQINAAPQTNSQTIPLLETTLNPDANSAKGGGNITIVNNNALLSDSGHLGTMADLEEAKPNQGQISIYVVRKGDTLSEIAEMFGVSVNTIRWANDLSPGEQIKVGQTLIILPVTGIQYTVKKEDTIKTIAKKFNGDIDEILQFNNLASNDILTGGQVIIIPNGDYSESEQQASSAPKPKISPGPTYAGYYLRPIDAGRRSQGIHGYNAVDLADSCGTPIFASASGDVLIARTYGWNAGYGNYIVLSHPNGTQTLYAHLSKIIVSSGWYVTKGQIIGYIGNTGRTTGCHVHFEIRGAKNPF
jgi:murein DD-endopeptidase MepM/ murein hydrolase activator NlpD